MPVSSARKATRFRWVAVVFFGLIALGLALAIVVHERYVAYEAVAAQHLTKDAPVLARFDLTHVMFYEPFRRSIAPLAGRLPPRAESRGREQRLEARGVRVAGDIREVAVALGPEPGAWTVALGGRLQKTGLDRALADILREEGTHLSTEGNIFVADAPSFAFAQAGDGALVLASSPARLRGALVPQPSPPELTEGSGGVLVSGPVLPAPVTALRAGFRAGSVVAVEGDVSFQPGSDETARSRALAAVFAALGGSDPDVRAAFDRAARSGSGATEHVVVRLPREAVLALANRAAAVILGE